MIVSKTAQIQIQKMQTALNALNELGYSIDFVEDAVCIVHGNSLKQEMKKPFKEINTGNYVARVLYNKHSTHEFKKRQ